MRCAKIILIEFGHAIIRDKSNQFFEQENVATCAVELKTFPFVGSGGSGLFNSVTVVFEHDQQLKPR